MAPGPNRAASDALRGWGQRTLANRDAQRDGEHMTDVITPRGLSTEEAVQLLATEGHNRVATAPPPRLVGRVVRQLADPLVALLLASGAVTTFLGDLTDTVVILLVL